MKRLFRIGSGYFIFSIIPILSWIVLSHVLGDSRISNVFSITYAMQFVYGILKLLFGTGADIRKEKQQDSNAVMNGLFWGILFSILIFVIPLIFVDNYISFFGQDVEFYRIFVIYSLLQLFLQSLFSLVLEKLYFEDKENLANILLFAFNILNFALLILTALISKSSLIAVCVTLSVLFVFILVLYIWQFRKFKIDFKFYKNIRYVSAEVVSYVAMMLIYLFGFKTAFSMGEEYLAALNIVGLCTDTQWDTMGAIETVANVDISKGRYDYKKELKNAYIFTIILILTSIAMSFSMAAINKASFKLVSIYLALQVADMLLHVFTSIVSIYTQIEYSPTLNTAISLFIRIIRTVISVTLISAFCTDIAQLTTGFLSFVAMLIIRIVKYKVVDGKLTIKQKETQKNAPI